MSGDKKIIKVGSRKSELALIQTKYVIALLSKEYPNYDFQIVTMSTLGDLVLDKPLPKIGEKSLFTKELEVALAAECVDFVVHSLKDLPTCLPEGMAIGAVLKREDPRDALVTKKGIQCKSLSELKEGSIIGTSSLRRTAQLNRLYPHLKIENIRGNLNTRLKKLDELDIYSAIVLAKAGLTRMGWSSRITQVLDSSEILYAVGQGALAVECRENDNETLKVLSILHDPTTLLAVLAERSFLRTLEGGCSAPVAVCSSLDEKELKLIGAVWSLDGKTIITDSNTCPYEITDTSNLIITDIEDVKIVKKNSPTSITLNLENQTEKVNDSGDATTSSNIRKCPYDSNGAQKRLKPNDEVDNSLQLSKCPYMQMSSEDDCPISTLPVGVDFMGKCPYLEEKITKCPVNAEIVTLTTNTSKVQLHCPYFNSANNMCNEDCSPSLGCPFKRDSNFKSKLFCGLAGSKYISNDILRSAESLGINLANKLIEKGAKLVMEQAQSHIRGTSHEINKVRA